MRRRALAIAVIALLVVAVAAVPLLGAAGRFLVEADPLEHADAIVVLAGSYPDRILEAVALYREGWAPRIILCREPENAGFRSCRASASPCRACSTSTASVAEQLGVPSDAIEVLERPATARTAKRRSCSTTCCSAATGRSCS